MDAASSAEKYGGAIRVVANLLRKVSARAHVKTSETAQKSADFYSRSADARRGAVAVFHHLERRRAGERRGPAISAVSD